MADAPASRSPENFSLSLTDVSSAPDRVNPTSPIFKAGTGLALQHTLERLEALAGEFNAEDLAQRVGLAREPLERGEIWVVVVGQFKRGKSTLLNALLVLSPDPPLGEAEGVYLQALLDHTGHLLFVLNKVDLVDSHDFYYHVQGMKPELTVDLLGLLVPKAVFRWRLRRRAHRLVAGDLDRNVGRIRGDLLYRAQETVRGFFSELERRAIAAEEGIERALILSES